MGNTGTVVYQFERYVNFEFYKTEYDLMGNPMPFERYVNFEFYKTNKWQKKYLSGLRDM